jgi:hypothetical protein
MALAPLLRSSEIAALATLLAASVLCPVENLADRERRA